MVFLDALATVFPVLLLFLLGALLARRGILRPTTLEDLRGLVLRFTLPAALFLTFLRVSLEPRFLVIVVSVFAACVLMLALGPLLGRLIGDRSPLVPPLLTGFEAGMLGYAIYGAVYGSESLYRFAIVDIGQVVFVFFVLATVLVRRGADRRPSLVETLRSFVRTPVILAIAGGIAASALGLGPILDGAGAGRALLETLGHRVRDLRQSRGLTLRTLAENTDGRAIAGADVIAEYLTSTRYFVNKMTVKLS